MNWFSNIYKSAVTGLLQAAGIQVIAAGAIGSKILVNGLTISAGNDDKDGDTEALTIALATEAWSNTKAGATHNNPLIGNESAVILNAANGVNVNQLHVPRSTYNAVFKKGLDGNNNPPVHIKGSSVVWATAQDGVSIDTVLDVDLPVKRFVSIKTQYSDMTGLHVYENGKHYLRISVDGDNGWGIPFEKIAPRA